MKTKLIEYSLAGIFAGITIYVLMRIWNDHKRKSSREEENVAARTYRERYPNEFGEYTL